VYLAEGSTRWSFRTELAIANPSSLVSARVLLTIHRSDPGHEDLRLSQFLYVERSARVVVDVNALPGLLDGCHWARFCEPGQDFSVTVESSAEVVVERVMRWGEGGYGMHGETAVAASSEWYFAEGATHSGFALYYLLFNPTATEIEVSLSLFTPDGPMRSAGGVPVEWAVSLPPRSRRTVPVLADGGVGASDVSAVVRSSNGAPFVAERAMYLSRPGQVFAAGHASAGVAAPRATWYFAEGATAGWFDTFLLLFNPGTSDASVELTMLLDHGPAVTTIVLVPAATRRTIWVNALDARLASRSFGFAVQSLGGEPIVAERAMWWPRGGPDRWYEAHVVAGLAEPATQWVFADGEVGGADSACTYLLLANPFASRAFVGILGRSDLISTAQTLTLEPWSRATVELPAFGGLRRYAVEIRSTTPVVAERATYLSPGGVTWAAGLALAGMPR
jgi:hypothetical protein